jgi:16S rRNA (cytosine967-C5)-methyltransferase
MVYSVCTLTAAETLGIDEWMADRHPDLQPLEPAGELAGAAVPHGRGRLLLPQAVGTDGMFVLRLRDG